MDFSFSLSSSSVAFTVARITSNVTENQGDYHLSLKMDSLHAILLLTRSMEGVHSL